MHAYACENEVEIFPATAFFVYLFLSGRMAADLAMARVRVRLICLRALYAACGSNFPALLNSEALTADESR